jgi:hypothetical protein
LGDIAKRTVWNARKCCVSSAQDFCDVLEAINVHEFFGEQWVNQLTENVQTADEVTKIFLQKRQ